jgi:hypothetical protein
MKKHAERNGQSRRELSEQQRAAVELLVAGKTDTTVHELSGMEHSPHGRCRCLQALKKGDTSLPLDTSRLASLVNTCSEVQLMSGSMRSAVSKMVEMFTQDK